MPKRKTSRTTSILFLLLNVVLWGSALPIVKPALDVTTPFRFLFYRFAFASLFSIPLLLHYLPHIKHKLSTIKTITFVEMLQAISLALLYSGLALTTSIEASLIATTTPIFTTLGGIFFLKEKQERKEWLGLGLAVAGTILLAIEPIFAGVNVETSFSLWGNVMIFLQNIFIAGYFLLAKKKYKKIPKLFATSISFYVGAITFFLLSLFSVLQNTNHQALNTSLYSEFATLITNDLSHLSVLFAAFYMAMFGSIIGLTAYIKGQDGIEASEASLFTYLQPLVYIPLAVLWLGEGFTFPMLVAVLVIGVGVFVAEKK